MRDQADRASLTTTAGRWLRTGIAILGALYAVTSTAAAQQALDDTTSLAAFADEFFAGQMAERRIPGAVLVVVRGDRILLSRGYGFADVEQGIAVDPDRTRFRVGSVSKLFTATAAMQLVEREQLALHEDVNSYLTSAQLTPAFGRPITLHHLLTHTPGFEERLVGMAAPPGASPPPLREVLRSGLPARVRPPGDVISYSNHGSSLVGLVIEDVTGMPFHQYVNRHVLVPLGMQRSGFRIEHDREHELARGYELKEGEYHPIPLDLVLLEPAGSFTATGVDMARFLMANLRGGSHQGEHILQPATLQAMHTMQVGHPDVAAWGYGFYVSARTGQPLLMHTGGWRDFRALLFLLPDADVGVFLSYNRADEGPLEMQEDFMQRFLERYVEAVDQVPRAVADSELDLRAFEGRYRYVRRSHTGPEKILSAFGADVRVRHDGDELRATGLAPAPIRLTPVGDLGFWREDGRALVRFVELRDGRPMRLLAGPDLPAYYERVAWWENPALHAVALALLMLVNLSTMTGWLAVRLRRAVRRRRGGSRAVPEREGRGTACGWQLAFAASAVNIVFVVAFPLLFFGRIVGGIPAFVYGLPAAMPLVLLLPWISAGLALTGGWFLIRAWRATGHWVIRDFALALALLAIVALLPLAIYWRVILLPV